MSPFWSWISNDSASLSKRESAVRDSTVSSLSLSLPISRIVNLWVLNLVTVASFGEKVYAGKSTCASFIAPSKSFGGLGVSADTPSITLNLPLTIKNTLTILGR